MYNRAFHSLTTPYYIQQTSAVSVHLRYAYMTFSGYFLGESDLSNCVLDYCPSSPLVPKDNLCSEHIIFSADAVIA